MILKLLIRAQLIAEANGQDITGRITPISYQKKFFFYELLVVKTALTWTNGNCVWWQMNHLSWGWQTHPTSGWCHFPSSSFSAVSSEQGVKDGYLLLPHYSRDFFRYCKSRFHSSLSYFVESGCCTIANSALWFLQFPHWIYLLFYRQCRYCIHITLISEWLKLDLSEYTLDTWSWIKGYRIRSYVWVIIDIFISSFCSISKVTNDTNIISWL